MEIYFNELSIVDIDCLKYEHVQAFVQLYKELKTIGITSCRISNKDNAKLRNLFGKMPNANNLNGIYFAFFRPPFESDLVNEKQDDYIMSEWSCDGKACFGPAMAYILESLCFSIYQGRWKDPIFNIHKDEVTVEVHNVSVKEHIEQHREYVEKKKEIELLKCEVEPAQKRIKLRHDHGEDVLNEFCEKLVRSPYVVEVINSLPFHPHDKNFIKKVEAEGIIEIVLIWTDCKFGVAVKTTGRNYRETCKISEILRDEYGYV